MVNRNKIIFSLNIFICLLLGACSPSNAYTTSNIKTFEKSDEFNVLHEVVEINLGTFQGDLDLIDFNVENDEIYMKYDTDKESTYIVRDIVNNHNKILYKNENIFATALSGIYKDNLYIVETVAEANQFTSYIVLVDKEKKINRYEISIMDKIPYVQQIDNLILVNYEIRKGNIVESYLDCFDIDTKNLTNIAIEKYTINTSETVTGDYILFAGGIEDTIYYQVVKYRDENIEAGGSPYIYKVNKNDINKNDINKNKEIINLDKKLIFISGDKNSLITSDYIYEAPFYDSGKIYIKDKTEWIDYIIDKVTAGNDIIGAQKINNQTLLIYTNEIYYLYDYVNKKYMEETYKREEGLYSRIKTSKNNFCYLEEINSNYLLHIYELVN